MSFSTTGHPRAWTRCVLRLIFVGISLSLGAGCGKSGEGHCQYQYGSSSGGICSVNLACGESELAASCTDTDCTCIVDGTTTGQRFAANGFCGQSQDEQSRLAEASCALTSDPGTTADAGAADPRCSSVVYNGMACRSEDVGASCAGTAACFCSSGPVNASTSCTCEEGTAFGRAWRCDDACKSACTPDAGSPDAGVKPDQGAAGSACLLAPQCIQSTTGSAASLALIAQVCGKVGGAYVTDCDTDHHDKCMVAGQGLVIYTDKSDPSYDPVNSKQACDLLGGVFTP